MNSPGVLDIKSYTSFPKQRLEKIGGDFAPDKKRKKSPFGRDGEDRRRERTNFFGA